MMEPGNVVEDTTAAQELLPAQEGFFFGSTDYDEYYLADVRDTVDILEKVLVDTNFSTHDIHYCASW